MSSTLGGPPPQDEAAKVLPSEPALDSEKEATGQEEVDLKSRSVQLSPSAPSADTGLTEDVEPHANGLFSEAPGTPAVVANTEQQKAEEDSTIGKESAIEDSGTRATSQPPQVQQEGTIVNETSNEKEFSAQESGHGASETSEVEGGARTVYVTSQTPTASSTAQSADDNNKTQEEMTQTPPMLIPTRRRVKVYSLSAKTGTWDDRGTGCVDIRSWDTDVRSLYCFLPHLRAFLPDYAE